VKSFNIKDYVVKNTSIFTNEELGNEFYKHLEKELNKDPWDFLQDLNSLKDTKNQVKEFKRIVALYIEDNSKKQLNISGEDKSLFLKHVSKQLKNEVEEWVLDRTALEEFYSIRKIIMSGKFVNKIKRDGI
jgi:hypothetical protein